MPFASHDRRTLPHGLRLAPFAGHDGWRLRGFDWPADSRRIRRGSLLFQSGRGDFIEKYLESLRYWHGRGWAIAGFDWRGQGGSDRAGSAGRAAAPLFDAMLADVAGYVADWRARTPPPHILVGHSMGGHLILRLLAEHAVRADAAVLASPMLGLAHPPFGPTLVARVARAACALGLRDRPIRRAAAMGPSRQASLTACADRYADEGWWRQARPELALGPPGWGWIADALASIARLGGAGVLERVATPVLLIATDRDRLVSAAAIRRAAARLPDARLEMFDGAHELLREVDAVRLPALAAIDRFLDGRAPAGEGGGAYDGIRGMKAPTS